MDVRTLMVLIIELLPKSNLIIIVIIAKFEIARTELTKGANCPDRTDGRTDPIYRKSFALKKNCTLFEPNLISNGKSEILTAK